MSGLIDLPDAVWLTVLGYLSLLEIGRLASVCKRLNSLIGQDAVWQAFSKTLINIHEDGVTKYRYLNGKKPLSLKEKCRISNNWTKGHREQLVLYKFRSRYLPWLQLDSRYLYLSQAELVHCFRLSDSGRLNHEKKPQISYQGMRGDVSHFVVRKDKVLAGGREGVLRLFDKFTGATLRYYRPTKPLSYGHNFICVDMTDDVILGGMNEQAVSIWRMRDGEHVASITIEDKIWSIAANPSQRSFATGNAGLADDRPIKIWDIANGSPIMSVGASWRHGAGILSMEYEDHNTLLSCGYDTAVRMWDLRTNCHSPVIELVDPLDYTIYCLHSDHNRLIASGTCMFGVVRLWDKRCSKALQSFFVGRKINSPVYSLQINGSHLYAAIGRSLRALNFGGSPR